MLKSLGLWKTVLTEEELREGTFLMKDGKLQPIPSGADEKSRYFAKGLIQQNKSKIRESVVALFK